MSNMRRITQKSRRRRDQGEQQGPELTGAWRSIGDHTSRGMSSSTVRPYRPYIVQQRLGSGPPTNIDGLSLELKLILLK
ncbi:hypothetical protein AXF42_Ash008972 [Apostasia shenzhenica]|uniref:Uncharacterized protein n=1 Tax=Apostasia shenzhenica TaxID=1088818 RepID=A0A2I0AT14_9ASPA|nr:hypothetical protein AXF42_Ash008971 [Apostasia shenzhenica]PKA58685.1 hypothetical protein AXF42_Ash008972 [Apostasia shenzhenica]